MEQENLKIEQAKRNLKKYLERCLLDFMGTEIQSDDTTMYYTMEMKTILDPLTVFVEQLLMADPNIKTVWRMKTNGEPLFLQMPEDMQNIIKTLRKCNH